MLTRFSLLLAGSLLLVLPWPCGAAEPDPAKGDEDLLKSLNLGVDDTSLLDYFRSRTLGEPDRARIAALIRDLGDERFEVREKACAELLKAGAAALAPLRQALRSPDIEVVRRAEECLRTIDKLVGGTTTAAAARLLARHKPAGAADVLLAFVPYADDDYVLEEVQAALTAVAVRDGKPVPVLLEGVRDPLPARRAAAAEALIRAGVADQQKALRKLLQDPDQLVRLRVGLALVEAARDREAIPVLIALLVDMPREQSWPAEDLLYRLAGEQAPQPPAGPEEAARRAYRDAWNAWWTQQGSKLDLAKVDLAERMLGYTLMVYYDLRNGRVLELGLDGKPRWQITGLQYPVDAQVVGNDRVLIAEYRARRVTERNFKGEVVWEKALPNLPVSAQRLANGNTLIAIRNQIVEVDREGKEVLTYNRNQFDITSAQKARNGQILFVTSQGMCVRLDAGGKELKSFQLQGPGQGLGSNFEILANGNILAPSVQNNKVYEYDAEGKVVWEANATAPTCVTRLPNGHTLVGSMNGRQIVELDKNGKQVAETAAEGRLMRIRRR